MSEKNLILVTDVGSTTTKARLFHKTHGEWRFLVAGEAPTTVESPYEDVTLGVKNAVREIEELIGHKILCKDGSHIEKPCNDEVGVDLYCTTSSAGGGLQMIVGGVVNTMTAESANRAALGAGAIVMDIIAENDERPIYEKIRRIRNLRPDMIMLAGGTDGGTIERVVGIAEMINAAQPQPRLGIDYKLPIVYAGNVNARSYIRNLMDKEFALKEVENIRPSLEVENPEPARKATHELFMEHVMSHAPGYTKLMKWTDIDIMPTPAGEGLAIQLIAKTYNTNVIGVGLGGATTNVYSVVDEQFVRSVSANLGMSYSCCNVMKESGVKNILRWIPFDISEKEIRNILTNKMIRPTTIPHTLKELIIEHAVAREALRLGLQHHKSIATRLKGVRLEDREITLKRTSESTLETYIEMMKIKILAGTGGLLSHAPIRIQSLSIMTDGFLPEGVTRMFQDSVFMMPHLGVLSTVHPDIAWNIFDKDCLVRLGTVIAPVGTAKEGEALSVKLEMPDGDTIEKNLKFGEIARIALPEGQEANAEIKPARGFDVGEGTGHKLETKVWGGVSGIIIDARGRPLLLPDDEQERKNKLIEWARSLELYPLDQLSKLSEES